MGLGNFARVHVQAYAADDTIKELTDLGLDLKTKLDHEHNKRVREKANAKVASAEARSKAAIDLAETKADFRVAVAEAEARGAARGEVLGFQRAIKETELFDAGFKGGRRQGKDIKARRQSQSTSSRQRQIEAPPALSMSKRPSSERKGASFTDSPHQEGFAPSNQPSVHSGRSRHSHSLSGNINGPPISMSASSRRSRDLPIKHTQYDNGSEASSHRGNAKPFHGQGSGPRKSNHEAGSVITSFHKPSSGLSREGLSSQRGTFQGRGDSEAVRGG